MISFLVFLILDFAIPLWVSFRTGTFDLDGWAVFAWVVSLTILVWYICARSGSRRNDVGYGLLDDLLDIVDID